MNRVLAALVFALAPISIAGQAPAAPPAEGDGQLLVIMDVSGSMERKDPSGTTLMQGAREAVREFVGEVPAETEIGLRLYGSEYAGDAEAQGCRDTRLAVPIAPASQSGSEITAAIDAAKPTGFTPIGYSLTEAAKDFSVEGERGIVLVSDGEDTCGSPAPCAAAKKLAKDGINVRVDTVGLFLQDNPAARKQLECIADVTGGTYVPADDTAALSQQLTAVAGRAVARFQATGEEIDGGAAQTQATVIEPGVSYVDDILDGEARWYSLELSAGQQVTVTGTDDGSVDYGCCIFWKLLASDGGQIDSANGYNPSGTASTYVVGSGSENGLADTGTYYVSVTLDDGTQPGEYGALPYEFTVEVTDPVATETPTATPSETPTATPSETPTSTSTPMSTPTESDASTDSTESSIPGYLWALIGLLGVAVVALGAMVLVLMRRVGRSPR